MKTYFFAFLLLTFSALIAAAEAPKASQIVGHWQFSSPEHGLADNTYASDGTFSGRVTKGGKVVWEYEGKWILEGNTLVSNYTRSELKTLPPGYRDQDQIVSVNGDSMVIRTMNGVERKWQRVKADSQ